jgi:hypothetical protein
MDEGRRRREEEKKLRLDYLKLPAQERVALWKKGRFKYDPYLEEALVVQGTDAVPFLANIIRNPRESLETRYRAMLILWRMDRFVPADKVPPPAGPNFGWAEVGTGRLGRLNTLAPLDGRRIGKEGYEVFRGAAEQTKDKELSFHAREFLGWIREELSDLTLDAQIVRWQQGITRTRGLLGGFAAPDEYVIADTLEWLLVERAPESLPPLVDLLENSRNPYVREGVISILGMVDLGKVRLRKLEIGRRAIEAVRRALEEGNLKPTLTKRDARQRRWATFEGQLLRDEWTVRNGSELAMWASAFEAFYGDKPTGRRWTPAELVRTRAGQEMIEFVTFLTDVDPYFACWEFCPAGYDSVFHPHFRAKMDRYYEQWEQFKAQQRARREGSSVP